MIRFRFVWGSLSNYFDEINFKSLMFLPVNFPQPPESRLRFLLTPNFPTALVF